ncbi:30S ribosomal protein S5 [bacterium]|nr:30S ribosomal protein S5 [bacterium]
MTNTPNTPGQRGPRPGGPGQRRGPGGRGPGGPGGPGGRGGFGGPRREGRPGGRGRANERDLLDMQETVIAINRVAKVVKGGRRFSFSAIVTVGDGKGKVGVSLGKANEIADAIRKASEMARSAQITVPILNNTIPYAVEGRFGASRVMLKPAAAGTGVIAAGGVRAILEAAGLKNILTKQLGSRNPHNVWKATMDGLNQLRSVEEIAAKRGISILEVFGLPKPERKPEAEAAAPAAEPAPEKVEGAEAADAKVEEAENDE